MLIWRARSEASLLLRLYYSTKRQRCFYKLSMTLVYKLNAIVLLHRVAGVGLGLHLVVVRWLGAG
jgi:hypothetical protein